MNTSFNHPVNPIEKIWNCMLFPHKGKSYSTIAYWYLNIFTHVNKHTVDWVRWRGIIWEGQGWVNDNGSGRTQKMLFPFPVPVPETTGGFCGTPGHGKSIPVNDIDESSPAVLGCTILVAACVLTIEKPMLGTGKAEKHALWVEDAMYWAGTPGTVFRGAGGRVLEWGVMGLKPKWLGLEGHVAELLALNMLSPKGLVMQVAIEIPGKDES